MLDAEGAAGAFMQRITSNEVGHGPRNPGGRVTPDYNTLVTATGILRATATPPFRLHHWDEIALEKVTEMISRKLVTGEREMLAQIYLKKGALVRGKRA